MRDASIVRLISGAMIVISDQGRSLDSHVLWSSYASYHISVAYRCIHTSGADEGQSTGRSECGEGMRQNPMVQFSALSI